MTITSLCSGGKANVFYLESGAHALLIDCGDIAPKKIEERLLRMGLNPKKLKAIVVTHAHNDHIKGAYSAAVHFGLHVWVNSNALDNKRADALRQLKKKRLHHFKPSRRFAIKKSLKVSTCSVPHNFPNCAVRVDTPGGALVYATDLSATNNELLALADGCDVLILEFHAATELVSGGDLSVEKRGVHHLLNEQAAEFLTRLATSAKGRNLKLLMAAHLGKGVNSPELIQKAVEDVWKRKEAKHQAPVLMVLPRDEASTPVTLINGKLGFKGEAP